MSLCNGVMSGEAERSVPSKYINTYSLGQRVTAVVLVLVSIRSVFALRLECSLHTRSEGVRHCYLGGCTVASLLPEINSVAPWLLLHIDTVIPDAVVKDELKETVGQSDGSNAKADVASDTDASDAHNGGRDDSTWGWLWEQWHDGDSLSRMG